MKSWRISLVVASIALTMAIMLVDGDDKTKDREECTGPLTGMATCLPYVQGQAKTPTPDCCSGLKQVLISDKKCLCVIIEDRNDPDLGLQINITFALALPSACHTTLDITKCPALLHLDPKSPKAQDFYQLANGLNKTAPASAPGSAHDPTSMTPPAGSDGNNSTGRATSSSGKNLAQSSHKHWLGLEVVAHFFVTLFISILV